MQVLRTYPRKRPAFPFATEGERSIARAYRKAFRRARRLIYIEDQYLWSADVTAGLSEALRSQEDLHLIALVPRYPEQGGRASEPPERVGHDEAVGQVVEAGGDRVAIYDLENDEGTPVYVHAKVCVVDDVWAIVGSDNLNLRSWTHDSELSCAVLDSTRDARAPSDPGGLGDGARVFARDLRLRLMAEHLGRGVDDADLLDPTAAFAAWAKAADELEGWYAGGCVGPRPPGRVQRHRPEPVHWWQRPGRTRSTASPSTPTAARGGCGAAPSSERSRTTALGGSPTNRTTPREGTWSAGSGSTRRVAAPTSVDRRVS